MINVKKVNGQKNRPKIWSILLRQCLMGVRRFGLAWCRWWELSKLLKAIWIQNLCWYNENVKQNTQMNKRIRCMQAIHLSLVGTICCNTKIPIVCWPNRTIYKVSSIIEKEKKQLSARTVFKTTINKLNQWLTTDHVLGQNCSSLLMTTWQNSLQWKGQLAECG